MFASVCFQDLKEKKLVEEKENGKDAATNGKVSAITAAALRSMVRRTFLTIFVFSRRMRRTVSPR